MMGRQASVVVERWRKMKNRKWMKSSSSSSS
jgi:hypothetical protein